MRISGVVVPLMDGKAWELKTRRSGNIQRSLGAVAVRISRDVKRSPRLELVAGAELQKCRDRGRHLLKRLSALPAVSVRNQGSADREDSAGGRAAPRMKSESAALGSLAAPYRSRRLRRHRGRCGALPARMGSGRFQLTRGESLFPGTILSTIPEDIQGEVASH
jgi:hypothetical protein